MPDEAVASRIGTLPVAGRLWRFLEEANIIGVGAAALAIYLALIRIRFWWHGLAVLAGAALFVAIISIAAMQSSPDPLARASDNPFSASSIARGTLNALLYMLMVYGAARGLRWLSKRARSKRKQNPS